MRSALVRLLAVLVVLQALATTAGAACLHERGAAAGHFGHHAHPHDVGAAEADPAAVTGGFDADCSACHVAADLLALPAFRLSPCIEAAAPFAASPVSTPAAPPLSTPERPKWLLRA